MPAVRLAMAQINPTVGRLHQNQQLILEYCRKANEAACDLVIFPEMALTGYPIEDLALNRDFLTKSEQALKELASALVFEGLGELRVLVGHPSIAKHPSSWAIGQNSASLVHRGQILFSYSKYHLPNYSVFDEYRVFVPGGELQSFEVNGIRFATVICEDIWQHGGPVAKLREAGVDICLVINGSPFELSKTDSRLELARDIAVKQQVAVCYVNLVGGQDDLVFDGNSFIIDSAGEVKARAAQFESELAIVEISDRSKIEALSPLVSPIHELEQVWRGLTLGLRDYVKKNGFSSVVLGLSGGIDSAVCAAIAVDSIGADGVYGVSMPSKFSSQHSKDDAEQLAKNLGIAYSTQPIDPLVRAFEEQLSLTGSASENLQARLRGVILMGISNESGHLVLTTGNKTELAVGYSTIYGDSVGGFAPIKDVEKSMVWELAKYRNSLAIKRGETPPIPESSITKAPSAELRPDQKDEDSLPPYALLDAILREYVEERKAATEIIAAGFDSRLVERVIDLVNAAEWKRRQGAIGPKITKLAFGRERRVPITGETE